MSHAAMGVEMRSNNLHTIGRRLLVGFDYIWSAGLLFCRVHFKFHGFLANTKTDTRNRIYLYTPVQNAIYLRQKNNNVLPAIAEDYNGLAYWFTAEFHW